MPPWDVINKATLIEGGVASVGVNMSLEAYQTYPWASTVPKDLWLNDVLPYGVVNEGRTNWRQLMTDKVAPLVVANESTTDLAEVALLVNSVVWSAFGSPIVFKSEQTPLIMDCMCKLGRGSRCIGGRR